MPKVELLQPISLREGRLYATHAPGDVVEVSDGVCASMVSLGQAKLYVPAPAPAEDKKGVKK
jgi:hypothetical protein